MQTGYEAWGVPQTKAAAMKYCNYTCAEFAMHTDAPFLSATPGAVAFEATAKRRASMMTVRNDQGGIAGGYPIEGIDDSSPSKLRAAFKLTVPAPPTPPGSAVTCNPKAPPPENCPGGKACPACGKPSCTCPK